MRLALGNGKYLLELASALGDTFAQHGTSSPTGILVAVCSMASLFLGAPMHRHQSQVVERVHHYDTPAMVASLVRGVQLPRDGFQPKAKGASLDFAGIKAGAASPAWHSGKAEHHSAAFADLQLVWDVCVTIPRRTKLIDLAFLGELFCCRHQVVVQLRRSGEWFLPLKHEPSSSVIMWPVERQPFGDSPDNARFVMGMCMEPILVSIGELDDWSAAEIRFRSPGWQQRHCDGAGWDLNSVSMFQASETTTLLVLAARCGFWTLGKGWLEQLAGHLGVAIPEGSTAFETLLLVSKASLDDVADEELLKSMEKRLMQMHQQLEQSEGQYTDVADLDDIFEKRDEKKMKEEAKHYEAETANLQDFRKAFREQAAKVRQPPRTAGAAAKAASGGRKYPKNLPTGNILQADAKLLAPPSSYLWKNNTSGAWCGKYGSYPELSRAWMKYSERGALVLVLRQLWVHHLTGLGMTEAQCPIRDLFSEELASSS